LDHKGLNKVEKGLYGFIWSYSRGYQLVILCVTIATFPLLYYALELPKIIVNDALGSKPDAIPFPRTYLGIEFEQTEYLLTLCGIFLLLLIVNGGIMMALFIFKALHRNVCCEGCVLYYFNVSIASRSNSSRTHLKVQ